MLGGSCHGSEHGAKRKAVKRREYSKLAREEESELVFKNMRKDMVCENVLAYLRGAVGLVVVVVVVDVVELHMPCTIFTTSISQ
jgi:hypothetical protein